MLLLSVTPVIFGERIAVILGFITLAAFLAIFASCRSCMSFLKFLGAKRVLDSKAYQTFNKYHGYYWWTFGYMLVVHAWMALVHTGFPAANDSDGTIHWVILWFAFGSLASVTVVVFSCRSFANLITFFKGRSPLSGGFYKRTFKFHIYYWLVLALAVAGHFAAVYYHIGIWPGG